MQALKELVRPTDHTKYIMQTLYNNVRHNNHTSHHVAYITGMRTYTHEHQAAISPDTQMAVRT